MKIILATGIFSPEIGGPAVIVEKLAEYLTNNGEKVKIITYTSNRKNNQQPDKDYKVNFIKRTNVILNYFKYFFVLNNLTKKGDIIIAFDAISAGWPGALVSLLRGNRFMIRLGGDFLWEQLLNAGETELPLTEFYKKDLAYSNLWRYKIIKWVIKRADKIILTNEWFFNIIKTPYELSDTKVSYIKNPFPQVEHQAKIQSNQAMAAGRFIKLKNFENLITAFSKIKNQNVGLNIFGQGPLKDKLIESANHVSNIKIKDSLNQPEFLKELAQSRFYIQTSLSEVSPNTVLQAISLNVPVLMSKNCGFYEWLKDYVETFDPYNNQELQEKIEQFYNEDYYQKQKVKQAQIKTDYSWDEMLAKYYDLIYIL